jgi:hypothetical protein
MTLPASGAISLGDVRTELGASGSISFNDPGVRALLSARFSNPVSLSGGFGRALYYDLGTTNYKSAYGGGVYTPTLYLSNYFNSGQLATGSSFRVRVQQIDGWCGGTVLDGYFSYGTSSSVSTSGCGSKSMICVLVYDGGNAVYAYNYYSGGTTSFPYGSQALTQLQLYY